MKRYLLSFLVIAFLTAEVSASHLLGGEITYQCVTSGTNAGKFIFTMKLYRACYQGAAGPLGTSDVITNPLYGTYGGPSSITLPRVSVTGGGPKCYDPNLQLVCNLPISQGGDQVMEENVYVSAPIQINGIPAAGGSPFSWSSCCRPTLLNVSNGQSLGYYLRAIMYPYTDPATSVTLSMGSSTGGASCYDSSPLFVEKPAATICYGYPFTYNHNASDKELDSLTYAWSLPMASNTNGVTWITGYNVNSQLPNASHNSLNVPAVVNPSTGEISFTTMAYPGNGYHATSIKVTAYKCHQKVAEIFRDIPVIIVNCPPTPTIPPLTNTPPQVIFKWFPSDPTSIPLPAGDTVMAGDYVTFYMTSTDIQFLPGFVGQTNYLHPSGGQFGNLYSDTMTGCQYPPCATLDTNTIFYNHVENKWEGQFGLATSFNWHTTCNHLAQVNACFTRSNTYTFVFKVLDNWCPAPGMNFQTFAVTVLAPPALEPPQVKCAQVQSNGNVLLKWTQPVTKTEDSLSSFRKYVIMRSDSGPSGPYDTLHIVLDIDSLEYLDNTASVATSGKYYYIHGISSCNDQGDSILGDTISAMKLTSTVYNSGNSVALEWNDFNPGNNWGSKTTGEYYIWQIVGSDTTLIDTTQESWDTLQIHMCYPTAVSYFVTVEDTSSPWGCTSNSTISGGTVGDNLPPPTIILDSVSYNTSGQIELGWAHTSPDAAFYEIYKQGTYLATVLYPQNTYQYTPIVSDPKIMSFEIRSEDTCGNANTVGLIQSSMRTKIQDVILCDTIKKVILSWNHYNPSWAGGAQYYRIYRSENLGPYTLVDSVNPLDTMYNDTSILQNRFYAYMVRSWENGMNRGVWAAADTVTVGKFIKGTVMDAPELRCISWLNDTTLRLEWNKPAIGDTNLNRYHIFWSSDNFASDKNRDSISGVKTSDNKAWDSTGYTINGATAGNDYWAYVMSASGCDGQQYSIQSETLKAIDLEVTALDDSTNRLEWNRVRIAIMGSGYDVHRDGAVVGFSPFSVENYTDEWVICNRQVLYQIHYPDGTGRCFSTSKEVQGTFRDDTPPAKQFVDSASMRQDTTYTGMVGWSPNASKDVVKYYAMQCTPGSYKILDTVPATGALYYEDILSAPLTGITQYTVMAVDSCGNNTLSGLNFDCHATMFLTADMDFCDQSIRLKWNLYTDFVSGMGVEYRIFASANGGQFSEVGRTVEDKFRYAGLVNGNDYCFYVQGWDNAGAGPFSSSTAMECLEAKFINKPDFAYMRYVTVHDTNLIRFCMKVDLGSDIGEYWVKRSNERDQGYRIIATIPIPDPLTQADSNFCFEDNEIRSDRYTYYYKVDVVDPCGDLGIESNHGRSILLHVTADNEQSVNTLRWNQYEEWAGGVNEYEVYRGIEGSSLKLVRSLVVRNFAGDPTVSVKGEEITFRDDVSSQATTGNGQFCYAVVAKEGSNVFPGLEPAESRSNEVCAVQYPMFYVPTAFTPNGDGLNDRFLPLGAFHDIKSYNLEIYNRWGERIFSSSQYKGEDAGWDGTYNGNEVPAGAYVYIVMYSAADGKQYKEEGTVTLTR